MATEPPRPSLQSFVALSRVLTGNDVLLPAQAQLHLERAMGDPSIGGQLPALLALFDGLPKDQFEVHFRAQVIGHPVLGAVAARLLVLWFTGGLLVANGRLDFPPDDPNPYFDALMWSVIGAHPPAVSGGYFGYWRYPPEN